MRAPYQFVSAADTRQMVEPQGSTRPPAAAGGHETPSHGWEPLPTQNGKARSSEPQKDDRAEHAGNNGAGEKAEPDVPAEHREDYHHRRRRPGADDTRRQRPRRKHQSHRERHRDGPHGRPDTQAPPNRKPRGHRRPPRRQQRRRPLAPRRPTPGPRQRGRRESLQRARMRGTRSGTTHERNVRTADRPSVGIRIGMDTSVSSDIRN